MKNLILTLVIGIFMFTGCSDDEASKVTTETNTLESLVMVTPEANGGNCQNGGQYIQTGVDRDSNTILDQDEVTSSYYLCNGVSAGTALMSILDQAPSSECTYGGKKILSGIDSNSNTLLEESEVQATSYICNIVAYQEGANFFARAQLGPLSKATVNIYKYEDNGSKTLLFSEVSSEGADIKDIGYFNNHKDALENDVFYLYEVTGGSDVDSDDNGVLDASVIDNNGTIRLIIKGSDLKNSTEIVRVSVLSEILYFLASDTLKDDFANLEEKLESLATSIMSADTNNDGVVNYADVLNYDPVLDQEKTYYTQVQLQESISKIHSNDLSYINNLNVLTYYSDSLMGEGAEQVLVGSNDTFVFVSTEDGVLKVDIQDPSAISYEEVNSTLGFAVDMALCADDSNLYLTSRNQGLFVYDAMSLSLLYHYDEGGRFHNLELSHDCNTLYARIDNKLEVFNVSNLESVTHQSLAYDAIDMSISASDDKILLALRDGGGFVELNTSNYAQELHSLGGVYMSTILYTLDEDVILFATDDSKLSSYQLSSATILQEHSQLVGSQLILSSDGVTLYANAYTSIIKMDISDPTDMQVGSALISTYYPEDFTLSADETHVYIVTEIGLEVIGSSSIALDKSLEHYPFEGNFLDNSNQSFSLSEDKTTAYIRHESDFVIYDLTNKVRHSMTMLDGIKELIIDEENQIIYPITSDGISLAFDISDKKNPALISNSAVPTRIVGKLSVNADRLFVAEVKKLVVQKIEDHGVLAETKEINTTVNISALALSHDAKTIYTWTKAKEFIIYDYSNSEDFSDTNFSKRGSLTLNRELYDLSLLEEKKVLFAYTNYREIISLDVSDVDHPVELNRHQIKEIVGIKLAKDGNRLYVITFSGKIYVLDISDPSDIKELYTYSTAGLIVDIEEAADGKSFFVSTFNNELVEFDLSFLDNFTNNTKPIAYDINISSNLREVDLTLQGSDINGDALTYIITQEPRPTENYYKTGTLTCSDAQCSAEANSSDESGSDYLFKYRAYDGQYFSDEAEGRISFPSIVSFYSDLDEDVSLDALSETSFILSINNDSAEAFDINISSNEKLNINLDIISATEVNVSIEVKYPTVDLDLNLEFVLHSLLSLQESNKSIHFAFDSDLDDEDNDGLSAREEVLLGTDPLDADSDHDGVSDGAEIALGLDPLDSDSDDNGICDGAKTVDGCLSLVIFVDQNNVSPVEDGSSWQSAHKTIQSAIADASSGQEIWIAKGTYLPSSDNGNVIVMKEEVNVRGGFDGNETSLHERKAYALTTLSGDRAGDGQSTDDSCSVVTTAINTLLEGFIITGGNTHSNSCDYTQQLGSGIHIANVSSRAFVSLNNIHLVSNHTRHGASIILGGNMDINASNISFIDNDSDSSSAFTFQTVGYNLYNSNFVLKNSAIILNSSIDDFGSMFQGTFNTEQLTCYENNSTKYGGLNFVDLTETATITQASFVRNHIKGETGFLNLNNSSLNLDKSSFYENSSEEYGGAILAVYSPLNISNSNFYKNSAGGVGLGNNIGLVGDDNLDINNTVIYGNGEAEDIFIITGNPTLTISFTNSEQNLTSDFSATDSMTLASDPFFLVGSQLQQVTTQGRSYLANQVNLLDFNVSADLITWSTENAYQCLVYNAETKVLTPIDSNALNSGSMANTQSSGTKVAIECFGDVGEPAVEVQIVPAP